MVAGRLVFIALLLLLGAFLVLAEFAIVRVRPTQLESLLGKDPRAHHALEVQRDLHTHLSSVLVGVTFCAVGFGALGEGPVAGWLGSFLALLPWSERLPWPAFSVWFRSAAALLVMTTIHVVLAELVPRGFAIRSSTLWALRTAKPLLLWSRIIWPLTIAFSQLSHWAGRLLGLPKGGGPHEDPLPSEEEFKKLLAHSKEKGALELNRAELIENVFTFSKRTIMEIAIPRGNVVTLDVGKSFEDNLASISTKKHSRFPLVDGDLDHVLGVIHLKDILWRLHQGGEPDLKSLARPAFFVPEMRRIQDLLLDFQRKKQQMALVVNEYGGVDGIVTMEDVMEELVGEIQDEFDQDVAQIFRAGAGAWLARGGVTLEQIGDGLGLRLGEESDAVTLGGYFQERLGRVLRANDEITIMGWHIRVLTMAGMAPGKFLLKQLGTTPETGPGPR